MKPKRKRDLWTNLNRVGFLRNYFEKSKNRYPWWCQRARLYDVLRNLISAMENGFINSRASAISFQFLKAIFPFILSLATLIPYLPIDETVILNTISGVFTLEVSSIMMDMLNDFLTNPRVGLMSLSFIYLLIATSRCISTIIMTLNNSAQSVKKRPWLVTRLISLALAFILLILFVIVILLLSYQSIFVASFIDLSTLTGKFLNVIFEILRWGLLLLSSISIISLLYYYSPDAQDGKKVFKLISPGAFVAVFVIGIFVYLYKIYIANFGNFNYLYGSLGAVIIFMIILKNSSALLVFGYELNAAIGLAKRKLLAVDLVEDDNINYDGYGSRPKPIPQSELELENDELSNNQTKEEIENKNNNNQQ